MKLSFPRRPRPPLEARGAQNRGIRAVHSIPREARAVIRRLHFSIIGGAPAHELGSCMCMHFGPVYVRISLSPDLSARGHCRTTGETLAFPAFERRASPDVMCEPGIYHARVFYCYISDTYIPTTPSGGWLGPPLAPSPKPTLLVSMRPTELCQFSRLSALYWLVSSLPSSGSYLCGRVRAFSLSRQTTPAAVAIL